jgi:hypothetical protein
MAYSCRYFIFSSDIYVGVSHLLPQNVIAVDSCCLTMPVRVSNVAVFLGHVFSLVCFFYLFPLSSVWKC